MGARLVERIGRAAGFTADGRPVRVWVAGTPGGDETEVVAGTIVAVVERGALVEFDEVHAVAGVGVRRFLAIPRERGWGLDALWFSFIAVDAFDPEAPDGEPFAHWFIRLGAR